MRAEAQQCRCLTGYKKNRSTAATQPATNPEDDRRKMSLEKQTSCSQVQSQQEREDRPAAARLSRQGSGEHTLEADDHADEGGSPAAPDHSDVSLIQRPLQEPRHHPRGPRCSRLRQLRNPDGEQPFPVERGYRISRAMLLCFVTFQCWFGVSRRKGKW